MNPHESARFLVLGNMSYAQQGEVTVMRVLERTEQGDIFHLKMIRMHGETDKSLRRDLTTYLHYGRSRLSRIRIPPLEDSLAVEIAAIRLVCGTRLKLCTSSRFRPGSCS
jgi:hypothetical protein